MMQLLTPGDGPPFARLQTKILLPTSFFWSAIDALF
jgi:hypothetical protein